MFVNAVYEGEYFLGTSIARPLISKRLVEIAKRKQNIFVMERLEKGMIKLDELAACALNPK